MLMPVSAANKFRRWLAFGKPQLREMAAIAQSVDVRRRFTAAMRTSRIAAETDLSDSSEKRRSSRRRRALSAKKSGIGGEN